MKRCAVVVVSVGICLLLCSCKTSDFGDVGPGGDCEIAWTYTPQIAPMDAVGEPVVYGDTVYAAFFSECVPNREGKWDDAVCIVALDMVTRRVKFQKTIFDHRESYLLMAGDNLCVVDMLCQQMQVLSPIDGSERTSWIDIPGDLSLEGTLRAGGYLCHFPDRLFRQSIENWHDGKQLSEDLPRVKSYNIPANKGDVIYFNREGKDKSRILFAYDLRSEKEVWQKADLVSAKIGGDGLLYAVKISDGANGCLCCLDPATGETIWEDSNCRLSGIALVGQSTLVGYLYNDVAKSLEKTIGIDLKTRRTKWVRDYENDDGKVMSDRMLYYINNDEFVSVSLEDGKTASRLALPEDGRCRGKIVLANDRAFFNWQQSGIKNSEYLICIAAK